MRLMRLLLSVHDTLNCQPVTQDQRHLVNTAWRVKSNQSTYFIWISNRQCHPCDNVINGHILDTLCPTLNLPRAVIRHLVKDQPMINICDSHDCLKSICRLQFVVEHICLK